LFPDARGTLKKQCLRQPAGGDSAYQPVADPLVTIQGA